MTFYRWPKIQRTPIDRWKKNGKSAGMCKTLKTYDLINYLLTGGRWCKISSINSNENKPEGNSISSYFIHIDICIDIHESKYTMICLYTNHEKTFFSDEPLISMTQVAVVMFELRGDILCAELGRSCVNRTRRKTRNVLLYPQPT